MMDLQFFLPRADLRPFVRSYYYFATEAASVQPLCAELGNIRAIIDGGGVINTPDGARYCVPEAFLIGPTMGAYSMEAAAGTRVFGVAIRPQGWSMLMGVEADEVANRVVDLSDLIGRCARASIHEIREAPTPEAMTAAADRFLAGIIDMRGSHGLRQDYPVAMEHWLLDASEPGIDALIAEMDISRRQTDRLAKRYFGASPKYLQRKYRALRAADRIRSGADWPDPALGGFYDQSHLIKEFKTFIGVTPRQFVTNQAALLSEIQKRRMNGGLSLPLASL